MDHRSACVLKGIVDVYVESQDPVGSRVLSKRIDFSASAATLRNIMADLEDNGYLQSLYTSSGRIPTEKALHWYIQNIKSGPIPLDTKHHLNLVCSTKGQAIATTVQDTLDTLGHMVQYATVMYVPAVQPSLKKIQMVYLTQHKAMLVMVGQDESVENILLSLPAEFTENDVEEFNQCVAPHVEGKTITEIFSLLCHVFPKKSRAQTWVHVLERVNIASNPIMLVRGHRHLFSHARALEDIKQTEDFFHNIQDTSLWENFLTTLNHTSQLRLFLHTAHQDHGYAVVFMPYNISHNSMGALGVLGPRYMDYNRIVPLVHYTASLMEQL